LNQSETSRLCFRQIHFNAALFDQPGLENFYTDPDVQNDPANKEMLDNFAGVKKNVDSINATTAYDYFTNNFSAEFAKGAVLIIEASKRVAAVKAGGTSI
jgi:hypothetical protein